MFAATSIATAGSLQRYAILHLVIHTGAGQRIAILAAPNDLDVCRTAKENSPIEQQEEAEHLQGRASGNSRLRSRCTGRLYAIPKPPLADRRDKLPPLF
jgi:hypothetical protein